MKTKKEQFSITLVSKLCDDIYEECKVYTSSFGEAEDEANDLAVEFSGFTIDCWIKDGDASFVVYTYKKDMSEEFVMTISKL